MLLVIFFVDHNEFDLDSGENHDGTKYAQMPGPRKQLRDDWCIGISMGPSMDIIYAYILGCIENKCKEAIKYR
jgi:hypothetical protein